MTHHTLRYLREQRGLTREQLADYLGDCTASTVNKWERGINPVPAWVQDKMLRSIPVKLPVEEMLQLLTEAQATGQSAESILADACRLWLAGHRSTSQPCQTPQTTVASTAASIATAPNPPPTSPTAANIVPLPPPPVVATLLHQTMTKAAETTTSPPVTETRDPATTYPKQKKNK